MFDSSGRGPRNTPYDQKKVMYSEPKKKKEHLTAGGLRTPHSRRLNFTGGGNPPSLTTGDVGGWLCVAAEA